MRCAQFMLAHHLAKVLAYTGEADVVPKILAIMPKGDDDQPGQIDLMYALRAIDSGWTHRSEAAGAIDWFARASKWRGGSTFSGHVNNIFDATVDAFTDDEKQLAYQRGAALRADHGHEPTRSRPPPTPLAAAAAADVAAVATSARPPGALRQPGVSARRPGGIAGGTRRRAERQRGRARFHGHVRPVPPLRRRRQGRLRRI